MRKLFPDAGRMFLVNAHNEDERSRDFMLRAYQIDHALFAEYLNLLIR
jgi:hypothetical protein